MTETEGTLPDDDVKFIPLGDVRPSIVDAGFWEALQSWQRAMEKSVYESLARVSNVGGETED
jgi:hypothetical protein